MARLWFITGCLIAGLGVAAGAFGAHALKQRLSAEFLQVFETGVRYQMYHAFGLLVVAVAMDRWPNNATSDRRVVILGWNHIVFRKPVCPLSQRDSGPRRDHADRWPLFFGRMGIFGIRDLDRKKLSPVDGIYSPNLATSFSYNLTSGILSGLLPQTEERAP